MTVQIPHRIGAVLAAASLLLLAGASLRTASSAAVYKCFGKTATIVGSAKPDSIKGTPNADVIVGLDGDDVIDGGGGNDLICGDDGVLGSLSVHQDDTLSGGDGNDKLDGERGFDVLDGGAGNDMLVGGQTSGGGDWVSFAKGGAVDVNLDKGKASGQGLDTLVEIEGVEGSPKDDDFTGTDALFAGAAFRPLGGDDHIKGAGHDALDFTKSKSAITASLVTGIANGEGHDRFTGVSGLRGSPKGDRLTGDDENNSLTGGGGNDRLDGSRGADTLGGGEDDDVLIGGAGEDYMFGDSLHVIPFSLGQVDRWERPGKDVLLGGDDNDTLVRDPRADTVDGGRGIDKYFVGIQAFDRPANVVVDLVSGISSGGGDADRLKSIENVEVSTRGRLDFTGDSADNGLEARAAAGVTAKGGEGNDHLDGGNVAGSKGRVLLDGGDGSDTLTGSGGNDVITGGEGNDILDGVYGDDKLSGEDGDDALYGGEDPDGQDHDKLNGGVGDDLCAGFDDQPALECERFLNP